MMKTKYCIFLLGILLLTSCNSFIDVKPQGALTEDVFFSSEANVDLAVNRIYGTFDWRDYRTGGCNIVTHEMCGDDWVANLNTSDNGTTFDLFNNFTYMADQYWIARFWEREYRCLNFCNVVIDHTPSFENRQIAQKAEAQAKFFRAYYHFDLTNVFGDIVIRDHVPATSEYNIPKSSSADVYKLIISDLKYAIQYLPTRSEWGTSGLGHITKGTAQGMLAKVFLFNQQYDSAQKYARAVIDGGEYSLEPNYRDIFSPDNTYSVENMMIGQYKYDASLQTTRPWVEMMEFQGILGSFGRGNFYPSSSLVSNYEPNDPRESASIFNNGDYLEGFPLGTTGSKVYFSSADISKGYIYANKKIIWPGTKWNGGIFQTTNCNPIFLRYADVLLVYAETCNELGGTNKWSGKSNTQEALDYLEKVRYRARGNKPYVDAGVLPVITSTDQSTLRQLIWHERRVELALEGHRWFDLVRYNKVVPGYTASVLNKSNFNYTKYSKFPLPATNVANSSGVLVQNSAW